jgi:hypothetical protein
VVLIAGLIYLFTRFAFKASSTLATTNISLHRNGVVKIYGVSPVVAPVPASDHSSETETVTSEDDFADNCVSQEASHYLAGIGSVVGFLVVLEIAKWIWWL